MDFQTISERRDDCQTLQTEILGSRKLILVSNRGPVKFTYDENGERTIHAVAAVLSQRS